MITASKSGVFEEVFALYSRNLFWRAFSQTQWTGLENLIERDKSLPLVLYVNHSSWWDGLVAFEIGRRAKIDQFVMMDERQLRNLRLFRLLGAFSVDRDDARSAVRSVNYAVEILQAAPNRALWIFPQGEILPAQIRPLRFYNGAAQIIKNLKRCYAAPVAMRFEFRQDFKPEAFARVGEVELFENVRDAKKLTARMQKNLTALLDSQQNDLSNIG